MTTRICNITLEYQLHFKTEQFLDSNLTTYGKYVVPQVRLNSIHSFSCGAVRENFLIFVNFDFVRQRVCVRVRVLSNKPKKKNILCLISVFRGKISYTRENAGNVAVDCNVHDIQQKTPFMSVFKSYVGGGAMIF